MRPRLLHLLPLIIVVGLIFLGVHLAALIHLFYEHAGVAVTQDEVRDAFVKDNHVYSGVKGEGEGPVRKQYIPKIIHQVFHNWADPGNDTLPLDWQVVSETCKVKNEGWDYKLWTEKTSQDFIEQQYPWFLSTYDGYRFPVQRVDAVRYFLMLHYGGIYLDLDNGCLRLLEPLLYYPFWTTDGGRGALSNNILGAAPNHPYYKFLTDSLIEFDNNYIFPYVTISYASGQWFETAVWEKYHTGRAVMGNDVGYRVMMDDRPGTEPWIFFTQERGGSWVNWGNVFWLWIGDHVVFLGAVVVVLILMVGWSLTRVVRGNGMYRRVSGELDKEAEV